MDNGIGKPIIGENIINELNLILFNVPQDINLLEKIRWLYIKTGEIFSYDYRVSDNIDYATNKLDFSENYINRYQTCTQISYIFNLMLNYIDGCDSKVIERKAEIRGLRGVEHVANEVTLITGEKLILDLTLDLYLIQSGCQTKQFGYTTNIENTCDIISLKECEEIDKRLGLIKNGEYTDKKIKQVKEILDSLDYSDMNEEQKIEYKINKIIPIIPKFYGYHESKQFVNKLFIEILKEPYKEFNLKHIRDNDMEMVTCFKISSETTSLWYLHDSKLGLIKTSPSNLKNMLNCGWYTKSETLLNELSLENKKR